MLATSGLLHSPITYNADHCSVLLDSWIAKLLPEHRQKLTVFRGSERG